MKYIEAFAKYAMVGAFFGGAVADAKGQEVSTGDDVTKRLETARREGYAAGVLAEREHTLNAIARLDVAIARAEAAERREEDVRAQLAAK